MGLSIDKNASLRALNSFGVHASSDQLAYVHTVADMQQAASLNQPRKMVLGGGTNVLFTDDYHGLVLKNNIGGIEVQQEDSDWVMVRAGGGVIWHELVLWCLERDYGGIQNLAFIPGTVGAAPIQNIGAYGVEFASVFESLLAVDLDGASLRSFSFEECDFGYRSSIFKSTCRGQFAIVEVLLKLSKHRHRLVLDYGAIIQELELRKITTPTIQELGAVITDIRRSKLPDPQHIGNAGSFFKNPIIGQAHFESLRNEYPDLRGFAEGGGLVKVPAAWLIEQCGWKGYRSGDAGIYEKHALVLVNHGRAKGMELRALAQRVQDSVKQVFDIEIVPEVNIL